MFFVKYSKKKYLKDIINGYIRFSPISSYREFEQDAYENGIADPYDGMARLVISSMTYHSKEGKTKDYKGNILANIDLEDMEKLGVFCLAEYNDVAEMDSHYKTLLEKFPGTTHILIIHSPNTFAKDLQIALPILAGGTVRYGEKMQPPNHADDMWQQALYKRSQYAYQKEFRFVITRSKFNVPFSYKYENNSHMTLLKIGDIEQFIAENYNKDIEIKNLDDIVLEPDKREKEPDFKITDFTIEEL